MPDRIPHRGDLVYECSNITSNYFKSNRKFRHGVRRVLKNRNQSVYFNDFVNMPSLIRAAVRHIDRRGAMNRIFRTAVMAAALFSAATAFSQGSVLKIGWGRRSLNPGKPVAITGQFYLRVSLGEYNPVVAEALAIENGNDAAIFVSADMVALRGGILDMVRAKLRAQAPEIPADKLIMNATHTHAGPSFSNAAPAAPGLTYMPTDEIKDFLSTQIADAVIDAWKSRAPGSVAFGYGFATVGHSRRTVYLKDISTPEERKLNAGGFVNGLGRMYGNTADDNFSHYEAGTDAFANYMFTFDGSGKLTGAVVNVPCPAQTNEHAWVLHAGFWHPVRTKLRAKYGDIGLVCQCAAAGDLSPRQLHYRAAELRRYKLKYPERYRELEKSGLPYPEGFFADADEEKRRREYDLCELLRAEDIAGRIAASFDEVLEWARKDKLSDPVFRHEVARVELARRLVSDEEYREDKRIQEELSAEKAKLEREGRPVPRTLVSRMNRCKRTLSRYEQQRREPKFPTVIHAVRIGDFAFASNRFELFIDFMHRIQGRSPFVQTIVVQLVADPGPDGAGSYLATGRAVANKGYSAILQSNQVSPEGGQQLVDLTVEMLKRLYDAK